MALLVGEVLLVALVHFVDKLCVGCQAGYDAEEQVGVIAHVLAAVGLGVVIHLAHCVHSEVMHAFTGVPVTCAAIPGILFRDAAVFIIE